MMGSIVLLCYHALAALRLYICMDLATLSKKDHSHKSNSFVTSRPICKNVITLEYLKSKKIKEIIQIWIQMRKFENFKEKRTYSFLFDVLFWSHYVIRLPGILLMLATISTPLLFPPFGCWFCMKIVIESKMQKYKVHNYTHTHTHWHTDGIKGRSCVGTKWNALKRKRKL